MKKFVIGEKVGMTQIVTADGDLIPVTVVKVGPSSVLTVKPVNADSAKTLVTVGYADRKESDCNKPQLGFFASLSVSPKKIIKSFQVDSSEGYEATKVIDASVFSEEEVVHVRGRSIGKGFAGTIKRHNFGRGPRSHGSKNYRAPGSIGAGTTPGRVLKGKRMAGHMGDATVTVKNLILVRVDQEKGLFFLKGAVPGKRGAVLEIFN